MEVRSAKLPRGFSWGGPRKPLRRRQWSPIPHPFPSFLRALTVLDRRAVSHSLHLSGLAGPEGKGREKGGLRGRHPRRRDPAGCAALIPAARFRSQFSRALTRLLSLPISSLVGRSLSLLSISPHRPPLPSLLSLLSSGAR